MAATRDDEARTQSQLSVLRTLEERSRKRLFSEISVDGAPQLAVTSKFAALPSLRHRYNVVIDATGATTLAMRPVDLFRSTFVVMCTLNSRPTVPTAIPAMPEPRRNGRCISTAE